MFIIHFQLVRSPLTATEPSEKQALAVTNKILYPELWPADLTTLRAYSPPAGRMYPSESCRACERSYLKSEPLNELRRSLLLDYSLRSGRFSTADITKRYSKDAHKALGAAPFYLRHPDIYEIDALLDQAWPRGYGCYWGIGIVDTLVDVFRRTDPHVELDFEDEKEILRCAELTEKGGERYYFNLPQPPAGNVVRYVILFR
jgi:hypothetical protein